MGYGLCVLVVAQVPDLHKCGRDDGPTADGTEDLIESSATVERVNSAEVELAHEGGGRGGACPE